MKSFFEDLGKKIVETTETVTSKAGEMMEIQRLRGYAGDGSLSVREVPGGRGDGRTGTDAV